jgi:hypothetical protein
MGNKKNVWTHRHLRHPRHPLDGSEKSGEYQNGSILIASMAGLLIKDFPPALHRRLKEVAARHHRSMTREALVLLDEALQRAEPSGHWPPPVKGRMPLTKRLIDWAKREGRT